MGRGCKFRSSESSPFPDTVSKVIHCRGRRAAAKPSSAAAPAVNNFAESAAELVKNLPLANDGPVRKAPRPARFSFPNPWRVCSRSPAGSRAAVQRSERTTSHEDSCIRSTSDGPPTSLQPQQNRIVKMQSWSEIIHYAGFDWATDHHDVIIDAQGIGETPRALPNFSGGRQGQDRFGAVVGVRDTNSATFRPAVGAGMHGPPLLRGPEAAIDANTVQSSKHRWSTSAVGLPGLD